MSAEQTGVGFSQTHSGAARINLPLPSSMKQSRSRLHFTHRRFGVPHVLPSICICKFMRNLINTTASSASLANRQCVALVSS
jgi:hypothetical protein